MTCFWNLSQDMRCFVTTFKDLDFSRACISMPFPVLLTMTLDRANTGQRFGDPPIFRPRTRRCPVARMFRALSHNVLRPLGIVESKGIETKTVMTMGLTSAGETLHVFLLRLRALAQRGCRSSRSRSISVVRASAETAHVRLIWKHCILL